MGTQSVYVCDCSSVRYHVWLSSSQTLYILSKDVFVILDSNRICNDILLLYFDMILLIWDIQSFIAVAHMLLNQITDTFSIIVTCDL